MMVLVDEDEFVSGAGCGGVIGSPHHWRGQFLPSDPR